jgi:hypothetical protein
MELEDINLIAHPGDTEELKRFVSNLKGQLTIRQTLLQTKEPLEKDVSHHVKYNRVRDVLKFICSAQPTGTERERRRLCLASLEDAARAMYALSFTSKAILSLPDPLFDRLIKGVSGFLET